MQNKFFTDLYSKEEANVIVFGVPLGANPSAALEAVRKISMFVEPFDMDKKKNLMQNAKIFDDGDLNLESMEDVTKKISEIISSGKIPLMLGGYHLSSLFSASAFDKNTKIIIFDAHGDMKDEYDDEKIREMGGKFFNTKVNDATWLRRLAEKIDPKNIFLIGVRSMDEEDYKFLQESKINFITANSLHDKASEARTALWHFTQGSNVYISLDIDAFDPSIAPAVDHPEPNGITFGEFQNLLQDINGKVVGMDFSCLKPIPNNEVTEFLAVRSIFEMLGKI